MAQYTNTHRTARISPKKVRQVGDLIRGKDIESAFALLQHNKRRSAVFLDNALKAAVANADQAEADVRSLVVSEIRVDDGPRIKRFQPKDRGRAHPIIKRTCHITVSVAEAG